GPQPMMRAMAMDSAAAAPVPIEAGELSVSAEVTVTWELRPARRGDGRRGQRQRGGMGEGMGHHMHGHHGMGDHHGMGSDRGMGDHRGMGGAGGMMPDAGGRAEPAFPHGHPGGGTRGEPGATGRAVPDSGPAD